MCYLISSITIFARLTWNILSKSDWNNCIHARNTHLDLKSIAAALVITNVDITFQT